MKPAELILKAAARAIAGQRSGISQGDAATAADALDALVTSAPFQAELEGRLGAEGAADVGRLVADIANSSIERWVV